ncbi:hypothetical protein BDW66DRAFT_119063 [Aspergillus desertorum]
MSTRFIFLDDVFQPWCSTGSADNCCVSCEDLFLLTNPHCWSLAQISLILTEVGCAYSPYGPRCLLSINKWFEILAVFLLFSFLLLALAEIPYYCTTSISRSAPKAVSIAINLLRASHDCRLRYNICILTELCRQVQLQDGHSDSIDRALPQAHGDRKC